MANTSSNMTETRPHRLFLRYLLPSLLGMMLMSTNILIDGLFVSHGIGEEAFAGVNIALPIYSVILSISLWIGGINIYPGPLQGVEYLEVTSQALAHMSAHSSIEIDIHFLPSVLPILLLPQFLCRHLIIIISSHDQTPFYYLQSISANF